MKITKEELLHILQEEAEILFKENNIDEGWKENILAAALAVSGLFGSTKGQAQVKNDPEVKKIIQTDKNNLTVPIGSLFQSGRYTFTDKESIKEKLKEIGAFLQKYPDAPFDISIESSESQVPNKDVDAGSIGKDDQGKPEYKRLEKGELAKKRAETATFLIKSFVENMKKTGNFKGNVSFGNPDVKIGKTTFNPSGGDKSTDDKFTKEQFVNIIIKLKGNANTADFEVKAKPGEYVHNENDKTIGRIFYKSRSSDDIKDQGSKNTGKEDAYFREMDDIGKFTGKEYKIPSDWFNSNIKPGQKWDAELLNKIKKGDFS